MNAEVIGFNKKPVKVVQTKYREISVFENATNIDPKTVESFGHEWNAFHHFDQEEMRRLGDLYFDIVTDEMLNKSTDVLEVGCGSGRFVWYIKERARSIVGLDPSDAIFAADDLIGKDDRITLVRSSASNIPFDDNHFDFVYSIGVLHHIPDTAAAMKDCVKKLRPGGYFLTYLYYDLENTGVLFRGLYWISNQFRKVISKFPQGLKKFTCDILSVLFYMPFVLLCRVLKAFGVPRRIRAKLPLFGYEDRSFYVIRNDALDRFGTPLEQRFSKAQVKSMMENAGLTNVVFSDAIPFWHAVGKKV